MNGYLFSCEKSNEKCLLKDFQNCFVSPLECSCNSNIYIGNNIYHRESIFEEFKVIIDEIISEWSSLQTVALYDDILTYDKLVYARKLINNFLSCIKEMLICGCPSPKGKYKAKVVTELKYILNSVVSIKKLRNDFVVKLTSGQNGDSPIYQYLHTFLEIEYYLLCLSYLCEANVDEVLTILMGNLIQLSKSNFQRQIEELFVCPCIEHFWLLIQIFFEKTKNEQNCFWKLFNEQLEDTDPMFCLWLLSHIARLQLINENFEFEGNNCSRIVPNYDLLLNNLKTILGTSDSYALTKLYKNIFFLLTNYWIKNAKIEVFQLIWDFYSKRLNISNKNYSESSALDLYNSLENIICSPDGCKEDFEEFIGILVCHLKENDTHWSKIKGRIYSQLGPYKLKELNEVGITHVMFLFSGLSTLYYEELLRKVVSLFKGLSQEKKHDPLMWNIFSAFLLLQVKRGHSLEETAPVLLSWIQEASLENKHFHLIKNFIFSFQHVMNYSSSMKLHQWLFLNSWLTKYLTSCYHSDMCSTLDILLFTLEKVENADSWSLWSESFRNHVYVVLKQISYGYNAPGSVGKIAGKLFLITPKVYTEIFSHFTSDNIPPKIGLNFLITALDDYPNCCMLNSQQQISVIQMWTKICLLTTDSCNSLTKIVTKLDYFPANLKLHLDASQDPLKGFIEYLGSDMKQHKQSNEINKLCEVSFGSVDKWLSQYLSNPDNESVVLRIYILTSLAFLHCGPLLYQRSRSSSALTKLLECLLLSSDFLLGKNPHKYVLDAVKKTWHIFYESLVLLKGDADLFLERTLKELITKYMPHFPATDNPILNCLNNDTTAGVLLEKISSSYFKHPVKESDSNLIKVTKMLSDFIESTTSVELLRLVITKTGCGLFELVIFHSQRNLAINLIKTIVSSALYPQVRTEFSNCIVSTTEKHMGFNATNYFQLMYIIAKFVPGDVKKLISRIAQQISNVERLRGVGFDVNLRNQFEKLENIVK